MGFNIAYYISREEIFMPPESRILTVFEYDIEDLIHQVLVERKWDRIQIVDNRLKITVGFIRWGKLKKYVEWYIIGAKIMRLTTKEDKTTITSYLGD